MYFCTSDNSQAYCALQDEYLLRCTHIYDDFRATLERVVQDVVFNDVISRYRDWIKVGSLEDVIGFSRAEYDEIARLNKIASTAGNSHDPSSAKNTAIPEPAQLKGDIQALRDLIEVIKTRRKHSKLQATQVPMKAAS